MPCKSNYPILLILCGTANTGKTTSLNLLIQKMLPFSSTLAGNISNNSKCDSWAVLEYNGKRIAVITEGDNRAALKWYFDRITIDCDIYVCASRTKGSSVDFLKESFTNTHVIWETKWCITEENVNSLFLKNLQDEANILQAEELLNTVTRL